MKRFCTLSLILTLTHKHPHLAFELEGENTSNEWLEPVNDEHYDKLK